MSGDDKVPAENKRIVINPSQTPEYGNRQVSPRKAPIGRRTGNRKPIVRQQSRVPKDPSTNTNNLVKQNDNVVDSNQRKQITKQNSSGNSPQKGKEVKTVKRNNEPRNKEHIAPTPPKPTNTENHKPLTTQTEGTRKISRKQNVDKTEGSRKPIVTDAMRAHGESMKTNIKMKAASKVPIVGEMLATKISKEHDNSVKVGKRISERASQIAKEAAVKSGGRKALTPEEAIQQATKEILDKSVAKPTSQHSAKEIKRIEKSNKKAKKTIDKATKFVDRSEIIAKMTKK